MPIFCLIICREIRMLPIIYYLSKLTGGGIGYKLQNYLLLMEIDVSVVLLLFLLLIVSFNMRMSI